MYDRQTFKKASVYAGSIVMLILLLLCIVGGQPAQAVSINALEASQVVQGISINNDFFLLTEFFGLEVQTLDYQSSSDLSGWSGTLSGTYLGKSLNVAYSGDLSAFPSGQTTWSSSGTYGPNSWSGSGRASIVPIVDSALFEVNYDSSLSIEGNSGLFAVKTIGTANDLQISHVSSSGTMEVNGSAFTFANAPFDTFGYPRFPPKLGDVATTDKRNPRTDRLIIIDRQVYVRFGPESFAWVSSISTVPEPSTFLLLGSGLAGLGIGAWRRRAKDSCEDLKSANVNGGTSEEQL